MKEEKVNKIISELIDKEIFEVVKEDPKNPDKKRYKMLKNIV